MRFLKSFTVNGCDFSQVSNEVYGLELTYSMIWNKYEMSSNHGHNILSEKCDDTNAAVLIIQRLSYFLMHLQHKNAPYKDFHQNSIS